MNETFKGGLLAGLLIALLDLGAVTYIPAFPLSALDLARLLEYQLVLGFLAVLALSGLIGVALGANRTWSGLTVGLSIGSGLFAILIGVGIVF